MASTYNELINVEGFWDRKNEFEQERGEVSFYCKDCWEIVEAKRPKPRWYVFVCPKCEWKNIAIWTMQWLKENYRLN